MPSNTSTHTLVITDPELYDEETPFDPRIDIINPYPDTVLDLISKSAQRMLAKGTTRWADKLRVLDLDTGEIDEVNFTPYETEDDIVHHRKGDLSWTTVGKRAKDGQGQHRDASAALRNCTFEDICSMAYLNWFERYKKNLPANIDVSVERAIVEASKPSDGMTGRRGHTRAEDLHPMRAPLDRADEEEEVNLLDSILEAIELDLATDDELREDLIQLHAELSSPLPADPKSGIQPIRACPIDGNVPSSSLDEGGFRITDKYDFDDRLSNLVCADPLQQFEVPDFTYATDQPEVIQPSTSDRDLADQLLAHGYNVTYRRHINALGDITQEHLMLELSHPKPRKSSDHCPNCGSIIQLHTDHKATWGICKCNAAHTRFLKEVTSK